MTSKKILLLGSGFVAKPCLEYLLRREDNQVTIACRTLSTAQKVVDSLPPSVRPRAHPVSLDATCAADLDAAVAGHDIAISLIPYSHHDKVIQACINNKKDMVTTSYVNPKMAALHESAKEAGITVINEIGLDPGIDHLLSLKVIWEVHDKGGKIVSFNSFCGALPAPDCADNFLGYKFGWSSLGVLMALGNSAAYWRNNLRIDVPGPQLMATARPMETGVPGITLEGYPNRDSTPYRERYAIPEAETCIRGTYRFRGFAKMMLAYAKMGFLDAEKKVEASNWPEALQAIAGISGGDGLSEKLADFVGLEDSRDRSQFADSIHWLGMDNPETPYDASKGLRAAFCTRLEAKMQYGPGERDMTFMQHLFVVSYPGSSAKKLITSTFVQYGDPEAHTNASGKYTAVARTVGVPCGIATQMLLDGKIERGLGVVAPMTRALVQPLLAEIEKEGFKWVEKETTPTPSELRELCY